MCVFSLEVLYSTRFESVRLEDILSFFFYSKSTINLFFENLYKVQLAFGMIIFLNKKDKEFTYFMLITGMKQRVFFKKKKKKVQLRRAVVS